MTTALIIGTATLLALAVLVRIVWPMIDPPRQQIIRDDEEFEKWGL